jgi:proteasome accessory factor A
MTTCSKVLGGDFELANALETRGATLERSVYEASRRLLDEIAGYPRSRTWGGSSIEWGRRFLPGNGGSAYIDSDHLEINLPEHTRAADHALHVHAGFRIAQRARQAALAKLPGRSARLNLMATVSDGQRSWGAHLNVCVTRRLWDDLFNRKPHLAGLLATHLATATLYTGQGQVGPGNNRPSCDYQLAQRPDFFEEFVGWQTTHRRPILNMRDEAHAGKTLARMHIIFFDNALAPVANFLKAGTTQLVLAMLEDDWVEPGLLLDDPLGSAWEVSRDLTFSAPLRLVGRGRHTTAVALQKALCDLAGEYVASGEMEDAVPDAEDILTCWRQTLEMIERRDLAALSRRVDWALKYLVLQRQIARHGLSWQSPDIKALDLRYASLDPQEGLFLQLAAAGQVEGMPSNEEIDRAADEPPEDTRAYLRAHLMRRLGEEMTDAEWDRIRFRHTTERYRSPSLWLGMPDPARWGKEESDPVLQRCRTPKELIEAVGQPEWPEMTTSMTDTTSAWGRRGWMIQPTGQDW